MIGGIVMVLTLIWVYQTGNKAKVEKTIQWVMICAAVFFASQLVFVWLNNYMVDAMRADQGQGYERGVLSIGDRKNQGGFQGPKGTFLSIFFELFPPIAGFLLVALIRTKYVLKESITKDNLFSGLGDMFRSIKDSFKNPEQQ